MALIQRWWRVVCVAKAYLSAARLWCLPRTCCFFSNNTEQTPAWKQKHNTKVKQLKYQNIINIRFCNQVYTIMDSLRMPVRTCDTKSKTTVCSTSIFIYFIYSVYSDETVCSRKMLQMPTSRFICIQTYVWRVCIGEVRWIVGNAVMLRGQLTDQAWQHQVAEECEQRPHTRCDEVTQSCRFVVRFTWVTNTHKAELLKHSGTEI